MMKNHELIILLNQGAEEIRMLRHRNEVLEAKVSVMDLFATVLFTKPHQQSVGMGEDVAWKMAKVAADLFEEQDQPKRKAK